MNQWHRSVLSSAFLCASLFGQDVHALEQSQAQPNALQVKPVVPAAPSQLPTAKPYVQGNLRDKIKLILLRPEDIEWKEGPSGMPKGCSMTLMDGDPQTTNLYAMRLKMPLGYEVPPHWHMLDEHITVISGTFRVGLGEKFDTKETVSLKAGSYLVIPARINYYIWASEETVIQVNNKGPWNIHYARFKDDPRIGTK